MNCDINVTVLHKYHTIYGKNKAMTTIREILGALFFFQSKNFWRGHVVKEAFLDYKCWYKRIVALPRQRFCLVGGGQSWYSVRATLFVFFKTFFAQIFDL
tara:strand:- start:147 stop:446 length:300 start_codon:yes stop_codon:yes gene_type:complete